MNRVDRANLEGVLAAARALLEARENQMLTAEEWDAMEAAVAACDEAKHDAPTASSEKGGD